MKDKEGHKITIWEEIEKHLILLGDSNNGKSYSICRNVEEIIRQKKKVLFIDFSGSFTEKEMEKHHFVESVQRKRVSSEITYFEHLATSDEKFLTDISDAFRHVQKIRARGQKYFLTKVIEKVWKLHKEISIKLMLEELLLMQVTEGIKESMPGSKTDVENLIENLENLRELKDFRIVKGAPDAEAQRACITIYDLQGLSEYARQFVTRLMMSLLWKQAYEEEINNRFDFLVLDEFQFIPKGDSTLPAIMREGRKKGLSVILATQFVSHYDKEELNALSQWSNWLIFHPPRKDIKFTSELLALEEEEQKQWQKILCNLRKGEAILSGEFFYNGRKTKGNLKVIF